MKWIYTFFVSLMAIFTISTSMAANYRVGEGDILDIKVYDHEDLTTSVRVGGDGVIVMPLIGEVYVDKKSIAQITDELTDAYADGYLVNPSINVFIAEYRSKNVTILGQVSASGLYELRSTTTFLELLSKAGGLTENSGYSAIIKRKTNETSDKEEIIKIDLKKLVEEGDESQNILLEDGDSIYIADPKLFYITGQVNKPGEYKFTPGLTVIKAVSISGGFTDIAGKSRVKVIRKISNEEKVLKKIDLETEIFANDVIVVPESYF